LPCSAAVTCGGSGACVSDRCVSDAGTASLQTSRRLVLDATEVALIQRGSSRGPGELPTSATLGRAEEGPAAVLLRFDVPADLEVLEGYLLVEHVGEGARSGDGVGLHAERIIGPWQARTVTWLDGPELKDVHAPSVVVRHGATPTLRLDVKPLFQRARGAEPPDQGVALMIDQKTANGVEVVLLPGVASPLPGDPETHDGASHQAPRLELYVK